MRTSHRPAGWFALPGTYDVASRYRADFFARVTDPVAVRGKKLETTYWHIECVYIDGDEPVDAVMDWCDEHAGDDALFALYAETRAGRGRDEVILVDLLAGEDPTPRPPAR
jgi:hypothetical protein